MFWHKYNKGEIATTLTLITIAVLTAGIFAGTLVSQRNTDTRSRAASTGDGFLVCDAGSDPYNSSSITVTNKTSETIVDIQSVMWSCKYDPTIPIERGRYKCETCTSGDEIGNPNCQVGVHDPTRSTEFTLAPGESKIISHTAKACETVQFDVYNQKEQGESPTECYNVSTTVIDPPAPNWWQGGIGFAINQNSDCTAATPTPRPSTPTATPRPCLYDSIGECNGLCGQTCTLSNGCYTCPLDPTPTPTPRSCTYANATECNGLCDVACVTVNGCSTCPQDPTITPTRTPTPTRRVTPSITPTPSIETSGFKPTAETCNDLDIYPLTQGGYQIFFMWKSKIRVVTISDINDKEFAFAELGIDSDIVCPLP
ncbi:MAG: hypothetical protein NUV98_00660 [Candidatus Roizmanbacteria bacterium]|nr:hypothetical protein [Candidatus Roizmanbacteria bacterium]